MQVEHLQGWITAVKHERDLENDNLERFVDLVQTTFRNGTLPTDFTRNIFVFLSKGNINYMGTGLIMVLLKTVTVIINREIWASVTYHEALHRFSSGRGTEATYLKDNLLQKLTEIREEVLYKVFLYLNKAHDTFNRKQCMDILV